MTNRVLDVQDSKKFFSMLAGGATPPDIFDMFASEDRQVESIEGGLAFDPTDKNNLVFQSLERLGRDVPDIPDIMSHSLPPLNRGKIDEEKENLIKALVVEANPKVIAFLKVYRNGNISGFGCSDFSGIPFAQNNSPKPEDDFIKMLENIAQKEVSHSNGQESVHLSIGKLSIKGGGEKPIDISVKDLSMDLPASCL